MADTDEKGDKNHATQAGRGGPGQGAGSTTSEKGMAELKHEEGVVQVKQVKQVKQVMSFRGRNTVSGRVAVGGGHWIKLSPIVWFCWRW